MDELIRWQEKYQEAYDNYSEILSNGKDNELAYEGKRKIKSPDGSDAQKQGSVSRKMCFELTETQADIVIPMPRVISKRGVEDRAIMIENVLRTELDGMNMEEMVDEQARLTPIWGGSIFMAEWDNTYKDSFGVGRLVIKNLHPSQVIPQPGVYKLDEMDYLFVTFEQTKDYIKRIYGVDIEEEGDQNQEGETYEHMRTHVYCYYRNGDGTIGLISWVGNTKVQDYKDYFARKQEVCAKCGAVKDPYEDRCPECGSKKFKVENKKYEKVTYEVQIPDPQTGIPINVQKTAEVKYYVPKVYPIVIHKNVGDIKSFLGRSDIDFIKDQQNDMNIYMNKIREKLLKGGSYMTLPEGVDVEASDDELKIVRLRDPAQKSMIDVTTVQPNIATDLEILNFNYQIGRQTLGITDSYQGREDRTATSGKAKQIAVEQSAGRLKSKQMMKDAAFADLYKLMFQFLLAYTDEKRPYIQEDTNGKLEYKWFDKRFFIEEDEDGELYYDDEFVFSVDVSGTLANDRQAMWQETRSNFESGAYGDPTQLDTLEMYWTTMNKLHYPCAPDALKLIAQRKQEYNDMIVRQQREAAAVDAMNAAQTKRLLAENIDQQNTLNRQENELKRLKSETKAPMSSKKEEQK
jgi:hypothetical protein